MKSIIIIGAGIAGLSAGIYARKMLCGDHLRIAHCRADVYRLAARKIHLRGVLALRSAMGTLAHDYYNLLAGAGRGHEDDVNSTPSETQPDGTLNLYTNADRLEEELLSISFRCARDQDAVYGDEAARPLHSGYRQESLAVDG